MDVKLLEVVGRGKFGTVHKAQTPDGGIVAVKILNLDTDSDEIKDIQGEVQLLSHLRGAPNIPHYHGSLIKGLQLWVIMDFCAGGSIRTLLKPGSLDERYIGIIARELFVALQFIHSHNVIHRDIKAANILISKEGNVRLCDFGVAAKLTNTILKRTTMAGTPYWMAPEVITEGATYNYKADIWSAGITIYEMATGNPPYSDKDAMRAMQLLTQQEPPRLEGRQYSTLLKDVISLCLEENPKVRPSADDVLKCKFVRTYKHLSTTPLKEIVGRYLLWRDNNNKDKADYEQSTEVYNIEEGENYDIKWDFDSLKSAEYIIDNDIEIDNYIEPAQSVLPRNDSSTDFISTFTMNNTIVGTLGQTQTRTQTQTQTQTRSQLNSSTIETTSTNSQIQKEGPKSLLNLFDMSFPSPLPEQLSIPIEEPELEEEMANVELQSVPPLLVPQQKSPPLQPPISINSSHSAISTAGNTPDPIEIPNMNNSNIISRSRSATVLMDVLPIRRPTISVKTPSSPQTKLSPQTEILDLPIKSPTHMKPLQTSTSQPLLQPLNQKLTPPSSAQTVTSATTITPSSSLHHINSPVEISLPDGQDSLPIQMPVPRATKEATIISPNVLARPVLHLNLSGANSPLNQFGIDAANTNGPPLAMTPVTEFPMMTNTITPEGIILSGDTELALMQDQIADNLSASSTSSLPLLINADPQMASLNFEFENGYAQGFEPNDTLTDTTFEDTLFDNDGDDAGNLLGSLEQLDPLFVYPVISDDELGLEFSDESLTTVEDVLVDIINDGRDSMAELLEVDFHGDPLEDLDSFYLGELSHMLEKISGVIELASEQINSSVIVEDPVNLDETVYFEDGEGEEDDTVIYTVVGDEIADGEIEVFEENDIHNENQHYELSQESENGEYYEGEIDGYEISDDDDNNNTEFPIRNTSVEIEETPLVEG